MARGLMALLASPSKSGEASAEPGGDDPELMAAEDLIEAVKGGDASSVKAAFQRMYRACADAESEPLSDDEYEEDTLT